jgi:hypothetical protein
MAPSVSELPQTPITVPVKEIPTTSVTEIPQGETTPAEETSAPAVEQPKEVPVAPFEESKAEATPNATAVDSTPTEGKPKVRRIIDEEGGKTTATVSYARQST